MIINLLLFIFVSFACTTDEVEEVNDCGVLLVEEPILESDSENKIYASPLSTDWDTTVFLDGESVPVISVQRLGCSSCENCRLENGCDSCGDCENCIMNCDPTVCVESISIQTPILSSSTVSLQIINQYGHTPVYQLEVDSN